LVGYGIDAPLTGAQRTAFLGAAGGAATAPTAPQPACPANFATAAPIKQQMLVQQPAYAGCRISQRAPSRAVQMAASFVTELFGIPAAYASDWSMIYFEVSTGAFFDNWGFEYSPGDYVAVSVGGARGVWANTGG
jgi:hypothetical protein